MVSNQVKEIFAAYKHSILPFSGRSPHWIPTWWCDEFVQKPINIYSPLLNPYSCQYQPFIFFSIMMEQALSSTPWAEIILSNFSVHETLWLKQVINTSIWCWLWRTRGIDLLCWHHPWLVHEPTNTPGCSREMTSALDFSRITHCNLSTITVSLPQGEFCDHCLISFIVSGETQLLFVCLFCSTRKYKRPTECCCLSVAYD